MSSLLNINEIYIYILLYYYLNLDNLIYLNIMNSYIILPLINQNFIFIFLLLSLTIKESNLRIIQITFINKKVHLRIKIFKILFYFYSNYLYLLCGRNHSTLAARLL